jgi:hypothetical protein
MHAIATENKEDAFKVYEEIGNEFEKLSEESKDKIYQGCCEFAMRLKDEA